MHQIVLIGTEHKFQIPGKDESASFRTFVETICSQYRIAAIGEEMSEDALAEKDVTQSVCQQIAFSRCLAHRHCDPDNSQRTTLHILQENDIRAKGFFRDWKPEKIETEIRSSHAVRERHWLDQLTKIDIWPALFVCGVNHVSYFRDLLEKNAFEVIVAADDWKPGSVSTIDTN